MHKLNRYVTEVTSSV